MFKKLKFITFICILLSLFWSGSLAAKGLKVRGKVTDVDNFCLPGVTVQIKGTTKGSVTDIDGNYALTVPSKKSVLVFSYLSMETQEIKVNGVSKINVVLKEVSKNLDDVVVIGYAAVKKKVVTGAVAQIKAEDINKIVSGDISTALQGQISGVNVTANSGAPGDASSVLIRGVTSVNGQNTPLYVVDGIPQEGDPQISSNEIASIDVLKDAASCAIYGTRGAAGVILITTKQGKAGKMQVGFDSSYGLQHINSDLYLMDNMDQTYFSTIVRRNTSETYDDQMFLDVGKSDKYFYNNTNLLDKVFVDNANVINDNINLSGGSKNITYSVTGGYYKKEGTIINSSFEKYNSRSNVVYKGDKLYVRIGLNLGQQTQEKAASGIITDALKYYPYQSELDLNQAYQIETDAEKNSISYVLKSFSEENTTKTTKAGINGEFRLNLFKGLQLSSHMGYNSTNGNINIFRPSIDVYDQDGINTNSPSSSYVKRTAFFYTALSLDAGLQYRFKILKNHFTSFIATTYEKYTSDGFRAYKYGIQDNNIKVLNSASQDPLAQNPNHYTNTLIGTIGRIQYDWDSKYLLNVSIRRDGSSKFAEDNRWGIFPSASAAWNISDENFFSPIKSVVNDMKLRASYGTTGNQSFGAYSYSASVSNGYDYSFGTDANNSVGLGSSQIGYANKDVKWETSKQMNIGLDLSMLNNRISFSAEYYKTNKNNMLFPLTLPASSGTNQNLILNVGDMVNKGFELAAGYRSNVGRFRYKFNTTFSKNNNEITHINGSKEPIFTNDNGLIDRAKDYSQVTMLAEGHEVGSYYLWRTDGIIDTPERLAEYQKIKPLAQMGDLIYIDQNGDGKLDVHDRKYSGSALPDFNIGFNTQLGYKQWDCYMNWYASIGGELMNGSKATAYGYGRSKDLVYAWSEANQNTNIPAFRGDLKKSENFLGYSDLWLEDGSYLRLKNISFGYTIPKRYIKKVNLQSCRISISAQNALTLTKYSGYDPEVGGNISSRGLDKGNYPSSALYMMGINLKF